jgi:formylglycine-generating enzyme required for sulfatase activity
VSETIYLSDTINPLTSSPKQRMPNFMKISLILLCFLGCASAQDPTELTRLNKSYEAAVQKAITPLKQTYAQELKKLKDNYTKAAKLEDAIAVDKVLKELSSSVNSTLTPATAAETVTVNASAGFALIPSGSFTMGDELDGGGDTHRVRVSAFYMAQNLVTKAEWDEVRTWGLENGYSELVAGSGKADNHPVQSISWYQMVKWCNARSQKEGLVPVYYTDDTQTTIYKTGDVNVTNAQVKWSANGYRLPTEAEWEKAARGGKSGKRFPWGDTISHKQANYKSGSGKAYDLSGAVNGPHPSYTAGGDPCTSPVGSFAANGYGLYDMAGNVWQRCWDWAGSYDSAFLTDPRGPVARVSGRVDRGGSWGSDADSCRVAIRHEVHPSGSNGSIGFRVARSSEP